MVSPALFVVGGGEERRGVMRGPAQGERMMRPRAGNVACHAGTFSTAAGNSCRGFVAAASSRLRRLGPDAKDEIGGLGAGDARDGARTPGSNFGTVRRVADVTER
jgi:hypothetical protein